MGADATVPADLTRFRQHLTAGSAGPHSFALLLGLEIVDWPHILDAVSRGLPYTVLDHLRENAGLREETVLEWIQIAPRTADRRRQQGQFDPQESERLLRAARILGKALELFEGDRERAVEWLLAGQPALGGNVPIEIARTELGAREVENLIGRIEHGVYS